MPHRGSRSSSTSAAACARSWVRLTRPREAPRAASSPRAVPDSRSAGGPYSPAPPRPRPRSPCPRVDGNRALGGETRGQAPAGVRPLAGVAQLARAEDTPAPHREQALSLGDVDQLDAARHDPVALRAATIERQCTAATDGAMDLRTATVPALAAVRRPRCTAFEQRGPRDGAETEGAGPRPHRPGARRERPTAAAPAGPRGDRGRGPVGRRAGGGRVGRLRPRPHPRHPDRRLPAGPDRGPSTAGRGRGARRVARHGRRRRRPRRGVGRRARVAASPWPLSAPASGPAATRWGRSCARRWGPRPRPSSARGRAAGPASTCAPRMCDCSRARALPPRPSTTSRTARAAAPTSTPPIGATEGGRPHDQLRRVRGFTAVGHRIRGGPGSRGATRTTTRALAPAASGSPPEPLLPVASGRGLVVAIGSAAVRGPTRVPARTGGPAREPSGAAAPGFLGVVCGPALDPGGPGSHAGRAARNETRVGALRKRAAPVVARPWPGAGIGSAAVGVPRGSPRTNCDPPGSPPEPPLPWPEPWSGCRPSDRRPPGVRRSTRARRRRDWRGRRPHGSSRGGRERREPSRSGASSDFASRCSGRRPGFLTR